MSDFDKTAEAYNHIIELASSHPDENLVEYLQEIKKDMRVRSYQEFAIITWLENAIKERTEEKSEFDRGYLYAVDVFMQSYQFAEKLARETND